MQNHLIYWPLLAQAALPIIVLLINGVRKSADVKAGIADREKSAMNNEAWSKPVILTSKNLANQFQFPVIFYVLCFILASTHSVSVLALVFAWVFVATRYCHAYVHITSNYVPIRMRVFLVGIVFLIALFVITALAVANL